MRSTINPLVWIGALLLVTATVPAATYYVDATHGSDGNDGLSPAEAWRTLDKVDSFSFNFEPGDEILFERGEVWNEPREISPVVSGAEGQPIKFGAYGEGPRPIIRSAVSSSAEGWVWLPSSVESGAYYLSNGGQDPGITNMDPGLPPNASWRLFEEETLTELKRGTLGSLGDGEWDYGDQDALGYETIYVRDTQGDPNPLHIPQTQYSFFFLGNEWMTFEDLEIEMAVLYGIRALSFNFANTARGYTLDNVSLGYHGAIGFFLTGWDEDGFDLRTTVLDSRFHHNQSEGAGITGYFHDFLSEGILPRQNRGILVDGCEFDNNRKLEFTGGQKVGNGMKLFWISNSEIRNSVFHDNFINGVDFDGSGFDTDPPGGGLTNIGVGNDDNNIHHNVAYANGASGIRFEHYSSGNDLHHNLIYNNGLNAFGGAITISHASSNNLIRFNVAYGQKGGPAIAVLFDGDGTVRSTGNRIVHNTTDRGGMNGPSNISLVNGKDTTVKNNVMINGSDAATFNLHLQNAPPDPGVQEYDYNLWIFRDRMRWGNQQWDLATYRSNTGHGLHTQFEPFPANFADPGPPTFDYTPAAGGCIDYGGDVGLGPEVYADGDFLGRPVDPLSPPRGAFIWNGAVPPPPGKIPGTLRMWKYRMLLRAEWDKSSCAGSDGYGIYEGTLGDWDSHTAKDCTGDYEAKWIMPGSGDRYYLIVPHSSCAEGSYGAASTGVERPSGSATCAERQVLTCF